MTQMDDFDRYLDEQGATNAERLFLAVGTIVRDVGLQISAARQQQGFSIDDLARRAGCSASYLRAIERGAAAPNLRLLARLVLALGVRVDLRPVPGTRWISNRPLTPAERAYARTLVADVEDTNAQ